MKLTTICMKCQSLLSGKCKKNISKWCLLNFFTEHAKLLLFQSGGPNHTFANSVELDETARNKQSHQDLHRFPFGFVESASDS